MEALPMLFRFAFSAFALFGICLTPAPAAVVSGVVLTLDPPRTPWNELDATVALLTLNDLPLSGSLSIDLDISPLGVVSGFRFTAGAPHSISIEDFTRSGNLLGFPYQVIGNDIRIEFSTPAGQFQSGTNLFPLSNQEASFTAGTLDISVDGDSLNVDYDSNPELINLGATAVAVIQTTSLGNGQFEVQMSIPFNNATSPSPIEFNGQPLPFFFNGAIRARGVVTTVPEPTNGLLLGSMAAGVVLGGRRRSHGC
jgi:hypothetical protein